MLKTLIDKYGLFKDTIKSVISLTKDATEIINGLFSVMYNEEINMGTFTEDALQAYVQLLMIESSKIAKHPTSTVITSEYQKVYDFFELLERETADLNF